MLGVNKVFNKNGSVITIESWNGRSMLKRLVQETTCKMLRTGKVLSPAGLKVTRQDMLNSR